MIITLPGPEQIGFNMEKFSKGCPFGEMYLLSYRFKEVSLDEFANLTNLRNKVKNDLEQKLQVKTVGDILSLYPVSILGVEGMGMVAECDIEDALRYYVMHILKVATGSDVLYLTPLPKKD